MKIEKLELTDELRFAIEQVDEPLPGKVCDVVYETKIAYVEGLDPEKIQRAMYNWECPHSSPEYETDFHAHHENSDLAITNDPDESYDVFAFAYPSLSGGRQVSQFPYQRNRDTCVIPWDQALPLILDHGFEFDIPEDLQWNQWMDFCKSLCPREKVLIDELLKSQAQNIRHIYGRVWFVVAEHLHSPEDVRHRTFEPGDLVDDDLRIRAYQDGRKQ